MTKEQLREKVRRWLEQEDPETARDDAYVDQRLPEVHEKLIEEADIARRRYEQAAKDAVEDHKRQGYENDAARSQAEGEDLRRMLGQGKAEA